MHAATNDLPRLIYQVARVKIPVTGSFESTLQIGGTFASPTYVAGLDASNVRAYDVGIESLFGEVRLHGRTLVLSNAGRDVRAGRGVARRVAAARVAPFRIGPPDQPLNVDVDVVGLDPGDIRCGVRQQNEARRNDRRRTSD